MSKKKKTSLKKTAPRAAATAKEDGSNGSAGADNQGPAADPELLFEAVPTRGFVSWLAGFKVALAVTTYQVGKLMFFGVKEDNSLWVFNRNIGRCLGLAVRENILWVSSDVQIYRFVDALEPGQRTNEGYDAFYVPQAAYFTGDLDTHDIAVNADNWPVFVNTRFNCLAGPGDSHSFTSVWHPPFISRLVAEDRCHLNGLAMVDGRPRYATAVAESDTFDGWRDQRKAGGIVIDINSNEIVCRGLSMPHSPRWYRDRLWLHDSGTGNFGYLDAASGKFEPICFCPGYLRGLDFMDRYAVMGLSKPRENRTFAGLALDDELARRKVEPRCGLYFVDLESGAVAHTVNIGGIVTELYDVAVIANKRQPAALGPSSPELARTISVGEPGEISWAGHDQHS